MMTQRQSMIKEEEGESSNQTSSVEGSVIKLPKNMQDGSVRGRNHGDASNKNAEEINLNNFIGLDAPQIMESHLTTAVQVEKKFNHIELENYIDDIMIDMNTDTQKLKFFNQFDQSFETGPGNVSPRSNILISSETAEN